MRISEGYLLREIAGTWVVLPIGERLVQFNGLISLSESGALLWKKLEEGAECSDLVELIVQEYQVSSTEAEADVDAFLRDLEAKKLLV